MNFDQQKGKEKTILSANHVVDILCYINEHGEVKNTDLYVIGSNYDAIMSAVRRMIKAGLIKKVQIEEPKNKSILVITSLGKEIADDLKVPRDKIRAILPPYVEERKSSKRSDDDSD